MLTNFLWIASLWLGIGLISGICIWSYMALARRIQTRSAPAVREVPTPRPGKPTAPFHVLSGGGGPKPMSIAEKPTDRGQAEAHLISVPGGRR